MAEKSNPADSRKFINPAQIGGIERYVIDDGPARGVRALWVNTGGGLRYRILVDRGLDIDQAFFNQISLAFLTHSGPTFPTRALDRGTDWLKGFPGGLLTTCGPTQIGPPGQDEGEDLGLHGPHSNSPVELESVHQPRPHWGHDGMSVTAVVRYGAFYGPCVELRRTIGSMLGQNSIDVIDEFRNAGNQRVPHALLLHINFGYPLVDEGAELCFDSPRIEPLPTSAGAARFTPEIDYKRIPAPMEAHRGADSSVAYLFPEPLDSSGRTMVGVLNEKLGLGVAVHYNTRQFPRCGNWQHFGPGEYVTALEPMNGSIDGRWKDREQGTLDFLEPGETRRYRYHIRVVTERGKLDELRRLNQRGKKA